MRKAPELELIAGSAACRTLGIFIFSLHLLDESDFLLNICKAAEISTADH